MVLPLIITLLSIVCLLIASSIKNAGKELLFLSIVIGILIIHSAHGIFPEVQNRNEDHQRLLETSFTLLCIPFIYILQQAIFFKWQLSGFAKVLLTITVMISVFLYFLLTFRPSMPLYSYANLIWSVGCLAILMLWQRLLSLSLENRKRRKHDYNIKSVHLISFQIIAPFLVQFACVIIPEDNFMFPYQPLFTIRITIYLLQAVLWVAMMIHIYNRKKLYDVAHYKMTPSGAGLSGII